MFADQISDDSEDEDEYEHEDAPGWELSTQHSALRTQNPEPKVN